MIGEPLAGQLGDPLWARPPGEETAGEKAASGN